MKLGLGISQLNIGKDCKVVKSCMQLKNKREIKLFIQQMGCKLMQFINWL